MNSPRGSTRKGICSPSGGRRLSTTRPPSSSGKRANARLAFLPRGGLTVRSYTLDRIFREGVDFSVEGKVLRRLAGGSLPYFQTEEYFRREPDSVPIGVNRAFSEIPLEGQRFLAYGERDTFTSREIAVSYEAAENDFGFLPQREKALEPLVKRLKAQGGGSVLFYGDSITVGCNASATEYGGACRRTLLPGQN